MPFSFPSATKVRNSAVLFRISLFFGIVFLFIVILLYCHTCESEVPLPMTLCNAVISTLFSVSYLVLEFQTSGTKVSHNCDCP